MHYAFVIVLLGTLVYRFFQIANEVSPPKKDYGISLHDTRKQTRTKPRKQSGENRPLTLDR